MKQVKCPVCAGKCRRYGKTAAGAQRWSCKQCHTTFTLQIDNESYSLQTDLLKIQTKEKANAWVDRLAKWIVKYREFLEEMTIDEFGRRQAKHERLIKAENSLLRLIKEDTLFTYLDVELNNEFKVPSMNNRIEGGVNSQLRAMLRNHRGLTVDRRIKAVYWWCYMHSPRPLSATELLKYMTTDQSIDAIYKRMNQKTQLEGTIPMWGGCNRLVGPS